MKLIAWLLVLFMTFDSYAQIGPSPVNSINTWRVEESYSIGQAVIRNGVIYQSLINNNLHYDPAGSPSQWSTTVGSTGPALPTATVAGQVPTSSGAGTTYTAQTPYPLANLPGTPSTIYSFVAPGDQTGVVVHDISGNGNNGTMNTPDFPPWTGTGFTFNGQGTSNALFTPIAGGTNQTHCMALYQPYYGVVGSQNVNSQLILSNGGGRGWYITDNGGQTPGYGAQAWQDVVNNGGGSTIDALPVETGFHTRCIIFRSGQSDRIFIDGVEPTYLSNSTDVFTGTWSLAFVTSGNSTSTWYYYAEWNSVLTDAQIQQTSLAMTAAVAARGVPVVPPSVLTTKTVIHAQGDSITCCGGTVTNWYPALLTVNSSYGTAVNEGFPGAPVLTFAEAAKWRDTSSCYTGSQPSIVTIFGGTNDGLFAATAQNTYNYILYDVATLRAAGCQVGVATMLSRIALDTFKNTLNPLIRAGTASGNYFLIDVAAQPLLGCDGCYTNGDFSGDNVHPNQAGQNLIAAAFSNAINANGIGSASSASPTIYSSNTVTMASPDRFTTIIPTGAATATLPDCLGVTGSVYEITNSSAGANTITFSGLASEAITGSATLAQNLTAKFKATLISQAAAGCGWQRL